MDYLTERRKYQRCSSTICKTVLSMDKKWWNEIELCDISAGGLKFISNIEINYETHMFFDISLYNALSEFNLQFEGKIVREEKSEGMRVYSVRFDNVNKYSQIQLDEVIKSRITVAKSNQLKPNYEEGIYTFFLIPRMRTRKLY